MRELTAIEIDAVTGAGWLQDNLAALGERLGDKIWTQVGGNGIVIDVPVIGPVNISDIVPDLGKTIGQTAGSAIGGAIESALGSIPVIGGLFDRIFGN
ncbi:hypothetical protein ACMYSN_12700 [Klebsiella sp. R445]